MNSTSFDGMANPRPIDPFGQCCAPTIRTEFAHKRNGVRHGSAQSDAGEKAKNRELLRFAAKDDPRQAAPNTSTETASTIFLPMRSAIGPDDRAPAASPNNAALRTGPNSGRVTPHSCTSEGAMNPMAAVSKPSITTMTKHKPKTTHWKLENRWAFKNVWILTTWVWAMLVTLSLMRVASCGVRIKFRRTASLAGLQNLPGCGCGSDKPSRRHSRIAAARSASRVGPPALARAPDPLG